MSKIQTIRSKRWHARNPWMLTAFLLIFGGIGAYLLIASHAATLTGCAVYTYKITGSTMTGTNAASNTAVCVNYIQKILNGAYQANYDGFGLYSDSFTAASPAASKVTGLLADDGNYSAQFMNRLEAFQTFFAYSGKDFAVDGTLTSGSPTVLALCGVGQHMPNPDAQHVWEQASPGAAEHFGCGTGLAAPTVSSRMPTPTATITSLTCSSNGNGTANVSFGAPSGPSNATLTITYANAAATTISYSATTTTHTPQPVVEDASKVDAGTWTAKLVVSAAWGGKTATASKSSSACKAPASPPPSGGGGTGGGGGSTGGGGTGSGGGGGSGGGSSSDTSGISGTFDTGGNSGTFDTSGSSDTIDTSGSSTSDSSTLDSFGSATSDTSGSSGTSGSQQDHPSVSGNRAPRRSTRSTVAAVISILLLVAGAIAFIIWRRRRQASQYPTWSYETSSAETDAMPLPAPPPKPEPIDPHLPVFPREDSSQTAARLNWWLPEDERARIAAGQTPTAPTPQPKPEDNPPDIFEEGRRRLEEEEWEGHIKH